jgi:ubiquitin-like 1-activating enzyme E1 B
MFFELFSFVWHLKSREEFDEEKEPDGMVLSGWTQPENKEESVSNGANTSDTPATAVESENDDDIGIVSPVKKRKLPDDSDKSNTADDTRHHKQLQVIDDEDDLVMLDGNLDGFKKRRVS